jgi:putative DNA primase/helicase
MNLLTETIDAMRRAGMAPEDTSRIRLDGVLCRFDAEDDKRGKRNAWCVVFADGARPVVAFGHWAKGIRETLVLGSGDPITLIEREKQRNAVAQARAARESQLRHQHELARATANSQWLAAEPANEFHPYLHRKGIDAVGSRHHHGFLVVPLRDEQGRIWNLQRIRADGQKRFLRGGKVQGLYASIGGPVSDHLVVCEGWATGKSLHAATGLPVAVAFSAGNLLAIAKTMRGKYPTARITVAADNDQKPDGSNPGLAAATAAAGAVDGYLAVPPAAGDFNDYAAHGGSFETIEAPRNERHDA